jgi:hypothetical protein
MIKVTLEYYTEDADMHDRWAQDALHSNDLTGGSGIAFHLGETRTVEAVCTTCAQFLAGRGGFDSHT